MNDFRRQRIAMTQLNFPPGTRIVLNHMDDPYAPVPTGIRGTVRAVDDVGHYGWLSVLRYKFIISLKNIRLYIPK